MAQLTLYGSSVADTTLTTACKMATTAGGSETSALTTTVGGSGNWCEILPRGGTSTGVASIPATPTGNGWVFAPGAGTFALGTWSASFTFSGAGFGASTTIQVRFSRYSGGVYTVIGSLPALAPASNAKGTLSFTATSMASIPFGATDLVYVEAWINDTTGVAGDNPTVYESTTATAGVTGDAQVTTANFAPLVSSPKPRYIRRPFGGTIIPDTVTQPRSYVRRALSSTLINEIRTFIPRALGGTYIPDTWKLIPRALGGTLITSLNKIRSVGLRTVVSTTYYANPGDNLQTKASLLQPGDTLILNDGTYNTSPGLYISGIHGTAAYPITIKAANDGAAIIDGLSGGIPIFITNCSYVTLQGLHAQNSNGNVVYIYAGSGGGNGPVDHVTLKRITACNAGSGNSHVFSTSFGATNCLLEDCAGWGQGRYIFDTYRTHYTTLRRCFAYWQTVSDPVAEPRAPFNMYASDHMLMENCIGLNAFPFAADSANNNYTSLWQTTDDTTLWPTDNCSLYGCIFYNCYEGYWLNNFSGSNTLFKDCYFDIAPTATSPYTTQDHGDAFRINGNANPHTLTNCTFRNSTQGFYRSGTLGTVTFNSNAIVGNTTGIAGADPGHDHCGFFGNTANGVTTVASDVTTDPAYDTTTYGRGGALYVRSGSPYKGTGASGSDIGANIIYQYQNGTLTGTALWPWPMEARIKTGTGVSPTYAAQGGLWKTLAGVYSGTAGTKVTGVRTPVRTQVTKSAGVRTRVRTRGPTYTSLVMADNPRAYYRLDEAGGLVAHDASGANGSGTLAGSALVYQQTGAIAGDSDPAMGFGANDTLSLPYTLNPSTWTALTLEFWIKLSGSWQYVAVTCDATGTTMYLNGAPYTGGNGDSVVIDQDIFYAGSFQAGALDEIVLYDYVLSPARIQVHYTQATTPGAAVNWGIRTRVQTQVTALTSLRTRVRTLANRIATLRTLVRSQVTRSTGLRTIVTANVNAAKSAVLRTLVRSQKSVSAGVRTPVRTQVTKSAALRVRAATQKTVSSGVRTVVRGITRLASMRTHVRTQVTKAVQVRTPVRTLTTRSSVTRTLVRTARNLSTSLRTNVRAQAARSSVLRAVIRGITRIVSLRLLVRTQRTLTATLRTLVRSLKTASTSLRTNVRTAASKASVLRTLVGTLHSLSTALRTRVRSLVTRSTTLRTIVRTGRSLSLGLRTLVRTQVSKSSLLRVRARTQRTLSTVLRVVTTFTGTLVTKSTVVRLVARTLHSLSTGVRTLVRSQITRTATLRAIVRGMTKVVSVRIVARGRSLLVGTRIPVRTVRSLPSQLRAVVRSQASKTSVLRTKVGTLATRSSALRLMLKGLTRLARVRVLVRSKKSLVAPVRLRVMAMHIQTLILRVNVRSTHTPVASIRVLVFVLPPVPNATLFMREGEADMTMRSGQATFYVRSGQGTLEVREQ